VQLTDAHCNALQHQPTQCIITLCSAPHSLSHTVAHCQTLQHTEKNYHTNQHTAISPCARPNAHLLHCNALQHTATHCNTLQYTQTNCNIPCIWLCELVGAQYYRAHLRTGATYYGIRRYTATHCNTHQQTASLPCAQPVEAPRSSAQWRYAPWNQIL